MKLIILTLCLALVAALPMEDGQQFRIARNIFTNFLGNIGILKVIPRECSTTSTFLGKGMCSLESRCTDVGGAIAGECERAGVCCVVPAVCGSQVTVKRSWFVNKEFPGTISESYEENCVLRILKAEETVRQIRLDFQHFILEDSTDGVCATDAFRITREGLDGEEDVIPILCGNNSGQHAYVDMPPDDLGEVKINIKIGKNLQRNTPHRSWRIYLTQLDDTEMAPKGCLQYYDGKASEIKSMNYDSSDNNFVTNADYDICFKGVEEFKKEADENLTDRTSFNVCGRVFSDVKMDQSFAPNTNNVLKSRKKRNTSIRKRPKIDEIKVENSKPVSENVVSQIQKVISTLQEDSEKKLRETSDKKNAEKMKEPEKKKDEEPVKMKETKLEEKEKVTEKPMITKEKTEIKTDDKPAPQEVEISLSQTDKGKDKAAEKSKPEMEKPAIIKDSMPEMEKEKMKEDEKKPIVKDEIKMPKPEKLTPVKQKVDDINKVTTKPDIDDKKN